MEQSLFLLYRKFWTMEEIFLFIRFFNVKEDFRIKQNIYMEEKGDCCFVEQSLFLLYRKFWTMEEIFLFIRFFNDENSIWILNKVNQRLKTTCVS